VFAQKKGTILGGKPGGGFCVGSALYFYI